MNKKLTEIVPGSQDAKPCEFCGRCEINSLEWGPMYRYGKIVVHYFCLLFSANLSQRGEDEDGILGFLPSDIEKEFKRGAKLKCCYCKENKATVGCSIKTCKKSFHYTCGYEKSCNFQFVGKFESYCPTHKRNTPIPLNPEEWECPICYSHVNINESPVFPSCCQKAVFHRLCIMTMAKHHGYFFKCPLCNDKDNFEYNMKLSGVFVPQTDAAWELEPNAFVEQNTPYSTCNADKCLCPHGRNYHEKETKWNMNRCSGCGSQALHKECGKLTNYSWKCPICISVLAGSGILSQSSEESEVESSSQPERQMIPIKTRISRPDYFADEDFSSSDSGDEPVENVTEILEWRPSEQDLENEVETPSPNKKLPSTSRISETFIGKNLIFNRIYQRAYKIEGGDDGDDTASVKSDPPDHIAMENAKPLNIDTNDNYSQVRTDDISVEKSVVLSDNKDKPIDFLAKPQMAKRRLDFDAKNASLPMITPEKNISTNTLPLSHLSLTSTSHSAIPKSSNCDLNSGNSSHTFKGGSSSTTNYVQSMQPLVSVKKFPVNPLSSFANKSTQILFDSPESNRRLDSHSTNNKSYIPTDGYSPALRNPRTKGQNSSGLRNTSTEKRESSPEIEGNVKAEEPLKQIEVINLDDVTDAEDDTTDADDDDEIQICDYVNSNQPIKIMSVASLSTYDTNDTQKSSAFMSMLNRFSEHKQNESPFFGKRSNNSTGNTLKPKSFGPDQVEEIVIISDDDDDCATADNVHKGSERIGIYNFKNIFKNIVQHDLLYNSNSQNTSTNYPSILNKISEQKPGQLSNSALDNDNSNENESPTVKMRGAWQNESDSKRPKLSAD